MTHIRCYSAQRKWVHPLWKNFVYNFKQYLNHKKHFQNVDKTKFNIASV